MIPVPRGTLVVSCQARADNPLHGPHFMAAMAQAAAQGGAGGIRAAGGADIAAIRAAVALPIIGLVKRWDDGFPVYITPDFAAAEEAARAGADMIAIDATPRPRKGDGLDVLIRRIRHELGCPVLADIATAEEARRAVALGADAVATTLSGYTEETEAAAAGPDLALVAELARELPVPVLAEGRFTSPEEVADALARGAHAVVVGTAITNPRELTRRFTQTPVVRHSRAGSG